MMTLRIDENDQVHGRERYCVRSARQPDGRLPALRAGLRVLVGDPDEGELVEAVLELRS